MLTMLKVSVLPSASDADGANEYALPATTEAGGMPEITGAEFVAVTVMLNAGNDVVAMPSLTRIVMLAYTPALEFVGEPCKRPVLVLKVAHAGKFTMLKVSALPSASLAVGLNAYADPATTEAGGVPDIVGAELLAVTVMLNAGNAVVAMPSLTRMLMFE
jgi:hypothetical protein